MPMRKILEIATQIIGVYLMLTAIPGLIGSLIIGCIAAGEMESLNMRVFMSGIAAPFLQLCIGLWAAFAAEAISRTFRSDDD